MSKIPSLNRAEAEFFRQMDQIATAIMASLDESADDAAGVRPEVEQWLRRGSTMVQEGAPGCTRCVTAEVEEAMSAANPLPYLMTAA